jgi:hypothetical protein
VSVFLPKEAPVGAWVKDKLPSHYDYMGEEPKNEHKKSMYVNKGKVVEVTTTERLHVGQVVAFTKDGRVRAARENDRWVGYIVG